MSAHVGLAENYISDRVNALDRSIQAFASMVQISRSPKLDESWRREFSAFLRRWAVERDSWASYFTRMLAWGAESRLGLFQQSYDWWARDFERRTGERVLPPKAPPPEEWKLDVPGEAWALVGVLGALWIWTNRKR
jgi:hypothetical protein